MWCKNCSKRRIARWGKSFKAGLCSHCAFHKPGGGLLADNPPKRTRAQLTKIRQSKIKNGGEMPREQKFKPLRHIGLTLRGRKFEEWANDYIKENM